MSHSNVKQHHLVRAHSVNSDVIPSPALMPDIMQTTPEPQMTKTNAAMPIKHNITQEQPWPPTPNTGKHSTSQVQEAPAIKPTTTKKLTGRVVLDKVMAMNDSAVSSLLAETESDSHSLFSSQE